MINGNCWRLEWDPPSNWRSPHVNGMLNEDVYPGPYVTVVSLMWDEDQKKKKEMKEDASQCKMFSVNFSFVVPLHLKFWQWLPTTLSVVLWKSGSIFLQLDYSNKKAQKCLPSALNLQELIEPSCPFFKVTGPSFLKCEGKKVDFEDCQHISYLHDKNKLF